MKSKFWIPKNKLKKYLNMIKSIEQAYYAGMDLVEILMRSETKVEDAELIYDNGSVIGIGSSDRKKPFIDRDEIK